MVTTRGGADTSSPQLSSVTRSGRKRFIDDSTPTRDTKKQRSSADEDTISVATPVRRGRPPKNPALGQPETPVARDTEDIAEATPLEDESIYGTPVGDDTPSVYATPATNLQPTLRGSARPTPASVTPKPRNRATRASPSKPSRLISSQTVDDEDEESTPKAAGNTHIRFGSEDPPAIPEPVPEPPAKPDNSDEEDSDDDAPEAVTATSAREQVRAAEQDAAKAVEKQEAGVKRKRQEHEARLKEQAAAARKRKQDQEPRQLPATAAAADAASSATIQASDPATLHKLSRASKPAYDLNNIPAFLPDDLLAAAPAVRPATPESDDGSPPAGAASRKKQLLNKHLKFLDEKPAKDVKKGPVKVRVLEKGNKFLPPKATSGSARDQWLQGRKVKEPKKGSFGGLERKKVGGGFLRK